MTKEGKVAFAIVKDGKVLLSGTDSRMDYLAGLAKERKADLYVGDSSAVVVDNQPTIMGFTFDEIMAAQYGGKLQHGSAVSTMPKNAVKVELS